MSTRKTTTERIELQKEKMEQMQNEMKRLQNQHRAEERKARTHRIIKRGALLESLLPDIIMLSDERFKDFIKRTTANDNGRKALAEVVAVQEKEDAANGAGGGDAPAETAIVATAQGGKQPAPKSAAPPLNDGERGTARPAQTKDAPNGADGSRTGDAAEAGG